MCIFSQFSVFGVVQGIIEHYADVLPSFAPLGPFLLPVGIGLLGYHYYLAAKIMDKNKVYAGFIAYVIVLVLSKSMSWGFPKDTAAEQIEALTDDDYVLKHFGLHVALLAVLGPTCMPFIKEVKEKGDKKN